MTRLAIGLIVGLASLPALAETPAAPSTMTDAERAAFRAEVRAYLLENPELLIEAMDVLQSRQEAADALRDVQTVASLHDEIFRNANDWVGGNPEGDITLVEFMDYRCGYCRKAYDEVEKLIRTDGNIRFVVKEFPILGEASLMSAQFAIAVRQLHGDAAYAKAHDALIRLRGEPNPETLGRLAGDLGLAAQPILDRMQAPEVMQVIRDNHALADKMQISGTPAFVLKDMVMRGYAPLEVMQDFVADARTDG
ncbi:DsbA family protein [Rhodobacter calidifons]|uniref:DsbA family protein n=1 Tax=Rhodobacter calidifons TaxID=2715277 RepID=A0ABX0G672_9RHOB|nr:DsbA family protein [Rhodobacter calidifons]NHB76778.1 DsbA family protein [Rhodobacter calidifons]